MSAPEYSWDDRKVIAAIDGREVGQITVPHIPFHFSNGVYVNLAGIQAVGTDASVRRAGIASGMMREVNTFALDNGYSCSAVSTDLGNVARRLYCNAGNVHLFTQNTWTLPLAALPAAAAQCDAEIRPYHPDDQAAVLALIKHSERPYFGTHGKAMDMFRDLRAGYRDDSPELAAFVAVRDGNITGFCDRFHFWSGRECEMFIDASACPTQCAAEERGFAVILADALLQHLAQALRDAGEAEMRFSVSECRSGLMNYLYGLGFRPQATHTFQLNILRFQQLIDELSSLFALRTEGIDPVHLPAEVVLDYDEQIANIHTGGSAETMRLTASRDVMTHVICGTISAWEAYLRATLTIEPRPTTEIAQTLQALLPPVPYQHPAVDRW